MRRIVGACDPPTASARCPAAGPVPSGPRRSPAVVNAEVGAERLVVGPEVRVEVAQDFRPGFRLAVADVACLKVRDLEVGIHADELERLPEGRPAERPVCRS